MKFKEWEIGAYNREQVGRFRAEGYSPLTAMVLSARGFATPEDAAVFIKGSAGYNDPYLLKDMDRAVARIKKAIIDDEYIAVYGDYDVDGITSTCELICCLREMGARCEYYIPARVEEGYGLNREAVDFLSERGIKLIVTVDCGITAFQEVEYARSLGIDTVITDHHRCQNGLPDCVAVVNPCRPDDTYPFKGLAGVGVAYKLVCALIGEERARKYIDLLALGTVADVMPLEDENRDFVKKGLEALSRTKRPGLRSLIAESGIRTNSISATDVAFALAPRLNAAGRMGQVYLATELLLTEDEELAAELASSLTSLNKERQGIENEIFVEAMQMLRDAPPKGAIVLASPNWHHGVIGIVSSKLAERFRQRVFLISLADGVGKASCRSFRGQSVIAAIEAGSSHLVDYGGHEMAAGFTILEEEIPTFRRLVEQYAEEHRAEDEAGCSLRVDCVLESLDEITVQNIEGLDVLQPFGQNNPAPVFCLEGVRVEKAYMVGAQKDHLRMIFGGDGQTCPGIFFNENFISAGVCAEDRVDVAFCLKVNDFKGNRTAQMQVMDIRPCRAEREREPEMAELKRKIDRVILSRDDARRLMPTREQFVSLWRHIAPRAGEDYIVSLPRLAQAVGMEPEKAAVCLRVFAQCSLISLEETGRMIKVHTLPYEGKAQLEKAPLLAALRRASAGRV